MPRAPFAFRTQCRLCQLEPVLAAETGLAGESGSPAATGGGGDATAGASALAGEAGDATLATEAGDATLATEAGDATLATEAGEIGDAGLEIEASTGGASTGGATAGGASAGGASGGVSELLLVEAIVLSGEGTEMGCSRTTSSGRTIGSLALANANPPSPTPTRVPLTAATFQLMRVFVM